MRFVVGVLGGGAGEDEVRSGTVQGTDGWTDGWTDVRRGDGPGQTAHEAGAAEGWLDGWMEALGMRFSFMPPAACGALHFPALLCPQDVVGSREAAVCETLVTCHRLSL